MKATSVKFITAVIFLAGFFCCKQKSDLPSPEVVEAVQLKKGELILCGPAKGEFGTVAFPTSCTSEKKDFDLGIALLHSFEYDEAEKVFAKIIDKNRGCAMAYWGVAMCNYHQVWPSPPSPDELDKGNKAIAIAQSIAGKTEREAAYINAISVFYKDWKTLDHRTRSTAFAKAMEDLHNQYPDDKEASVFYALTLIATADPKDKTYAQQKKAGALLSNIYPGQPGHPGIVHYLIHCFDSPELASQALPAARKYASIAPSSAHAQHMPSHIFTRLGIWDECINSNLVAAASAKCYAETAGIKGHWDEELHALDYLVYAYLQKGDNELAKKQLDYLHSIEKVEPMNFKVAYAYAAIPARYTLENKMWKEAANLQLLPANLPWDKFPWQKAIYHFARGLGAVHSGNVAQAKTESAALRNLHTQLTAQKESYKADQVLIQLKVVEAWTLFAEKKHEAALQLMREAASLEDNTEKSPVTPGEILPAKELLADMLMELNQPTEALIAYEEDLVKHPNRFNGIYGAGLACESARDMGKARNYFQKLDSISAKSTTRLTEREHASKFLQAAVSMR